MKKANVLNSQIGPPLDRYVNLDGNAFFLSGHVRLTKACLFLERSKKSGFGEFFTMKGSLTPLYNYRYKCNCFRVKL